MRLVALALVILLTGCVRLGSGDDLHLVCEERAASPRKAYDIGFLVGQSKTVGEVADKDRVALLEAARHHVITMGGRTHPGFTGTLIAEENGRWLYDATGIREGGEPDRYHVNLTLSNGARSVGDIQAPRSIRDIGWRVANSTDDAQGEPTITWSGALPSCVTARFENATLTVNVVQERVVFIG